MNTCRVRVKSVLILVVIALAVASTYLLVVHHRNPDIVNEEEPGNDGVQLMQQNGILVESRPRFRGVDASRLRGAYVPRQPAAKRLGLFKNPGIFNENSQDNQNDVGQHVYKDASFGKNVPENNEFERNKQFGDVDRQGGNEDGGYFNNEGDNSGVGEEEDQGEQENKQWELERRFQEQQELVKQQALVLKQMQEQLQAGVKQQASADFPAQDNSFQRQPPIQAPLKNLPSADRVSEDTFSQGQRDFPQREETSAERNIPKENVPKPQSGASVHDRQSDFIREHIPSGQDSNKQVGDAERMFDNARKKAPALAVSLTQLRQQKARKRPGPDDGKDAANGPIDAEKLFERDRLRGMRKPGMFADHRADGRRHPRLFDSPERAQGKRDLDELGTNSEALLSNRLQSAQDFQKRVVDQEWAIPPPLNPMDKLKNNALSKYFAGMDDKSEHELEENALPDRYSGESNPDAFGDETQENGFDIGDHDDDPNAQDDTPFETVQDNEDDKTDIYNGEGKHYNSDSMIDQNRPENVDGENKETDNSGPRVHVYDLGQAPNGSFDCVEMRISQFSRKICVHPPEKDREQSQNIVVNGKWEELEVELFRRTLKADGSLGLVDVGAGLGVYTVVALMEGRQVLAVEPFKDNYRLLHKTVQINSGTQLVTLVTDALGEKHGIGRLIYPPHDMGAAFVKRLELTQVRPDIVSSLVNIVTLDDLISVTPIKRAVLKLDTHGDENLILNGAEKFFKEIDIQYVFIHWLPKQVPNVFVEMAARLQMMGYEPVDDPIGRPLTEEEMSVDKHFILWRKKRAL